MCLVTLTSFFLFPPRRLRNSVLPFQFKVLPCCIKSNHAKKMCSSVRKCIMSKISGHASISALNLQHFKVTPLQVVRGTLEGNQSGLLAVSFASNLGSEKPVTNEKQWEESASYKKRQDAHL